MSEANYEVGIIGASLAGGTAALRLAQAGIRTVVFEKQVHGHRTCCGEGLSKRGVHYLRKLGLVEALTMKPHVKLRRYGIWLNGHMFSIPCTDEDYTLGIQRAVLDQEILQRVTNSASADLHFCSKVQAVERLASGFRLDFHGGTVTVKRLVLAAGASASLVTKLGISTSSSAVTRFGMSRHIHGKFETVPDAIQIFLQRDHEIYCTPVAPDCLNVAILGGENIAHLFKSFFTNSTELLALQSGFVGLPVDSICGSANSYTYSKGTFPGMYLIGDVRERFDPIGGMGMTYALATGLFAADALVAELRGKACSSTVQNEFEKRAEAEAAVGRNFSRAVYWLLKNRMRTALVPLVAKSGLASWACKRLIALR